MSRPERVIGWDIGGAHVKAALIEHGVLVDAAQWPCPLWQGLQHLQRAVDAAALRWPEGFGLAQTLHAVTMTGEMVDLFPHREAGVAAIGALLTRALVGPAIFYAGEPGWCGAADLSARWEVVASANWLATAQFAARVLALEVGAAGSSGPGDRPGPGDGGVLVDIGSTTTDLIALGGGRPQAQGRSDAERLATGELVYQGVVRTPLCALGPRVAFQGLARNVMNEFFATTADVYRLTGELDPAHDQHPAADGAVKDAAATRQRLARMVGLDARDAPEADWLAFARAWRALQRDELRGQLQRVLGAATPVSSAAPLVSAGCGDFLVAELAGVLGRPLRSFASLALGEADREAGRPSAAQPAAVGGDRPETLPDPAREALRRRVQVAAPACAVALLCSADGG
jgi:uncharacterized hydantoinase/oxoprolinase family protein